MIAGVGLGLGRRLAERKMRLRHEQASKVVASPAGPILERAEADFSVLQSRYRPRPEYGYRPSDIFKRASERSVVLTGQPGLATPGLRGLELGAGDGMLGVLLHVFGHEIILSDLDDWRVEAARLTSFVQADFGDELPFTDHEFDFIYSFNAFEHFPDPERLMAEIVRIIRPGGICYFSFNPLYCSPWGLHAYQTLHMPYPQFLFSAGMIQSKLDELGIRDLGQARDQLQPLNRWKAGQFETLWAWPDFETISCHWHKDASHLDLVLDYPECFSGRGLTLEDLVLSGVTVMLRKK